MTGNKVAEILDFESSFESGREEATKRRNERCENAKGSDVVLEGADKHRLKKIHNNRISENRAIQVNFLLDFSNYYFFPVCPLETSFNVKPLQFQRCQTKVGEKVGQCAPQE